MTELKKLLPALSKAACIGHHRQAMETAAGYLKEFSEVTLTPNGLRAAINRNSDYTLLLEAHIDEIGMIVTGVYDDGFLSVSPVGSVDGRFLPSTPVTVLGKEPVRGVFTSIPPHLKKEEETPGFDNCFIDTGNPEIKELVSPGDYALLEADPVLLANGRMTGKALDNRAGVAAVIAAAEKIARSNCPVNTVLLFPTGEELGCRGARTEVFATSADESISVDVSFGDCPDVPPHKTAPLDSGAMIGLSPVLSRGIYQRLAQVAEAFEIPHTREIMGGTTSTDADVIALTGTGIPAGLISVPLRNMHTPCEVISLRDVEAVAELIYRYVVGGGLRG